MKKSDVKESIRQFILYLFVGGAATIVEWVIFYALDNGIHIHYMLGTAIAFIFSTFANWAVGRMVLFHENNNIWKELIQIYMTSIAGLLMNLLIMWTAVDVAGLDKMFSKIMATGIVFFWNFMIRKLVIYKV